MECSDGKRACRCCASRSRRVCGACGDCRTFGLHEGMSAGAAGPPIASELWHAGFASRGVYRRPPENCCPKHQRHATGRVHASTAAYPAHTNHSQRRTHAALWL
eukprot:1835429-Prymnesium_polylepis.3